MQDLTLPEKLMLLALNDEKGDRRGSFIEYALAGAALADLSLRGIVTPVRDKKGHFVVSEDGQTGDAYLDFCLAFFRRKGPSGKAKGWVEGLGGKSAGPKLVTEALVSKGILSKVEKSFLFFKWNLHPEIDPTAEQNVKEQMQAAMFRQGEISPEIAVIIALADATDVLKLNFDKAMLKEHKTRIKEIAKGAHISAKAAKEAIEAVQAALMVAAVMPAIVATT